MAQRLCCPVAGIGIHFLTPTPSPPPLPRLLGFNGDVQLQEQMAKGHGYGFNMGHGKITPFKDYKEAAEALMERNFPEILHDRQTKVVFIPETHLPKMPHIVDLEEFKAKKAGLTENELALLGVRGGTEDIANASGDFVEKELSDALKEFYSRLGADTNVVVLQGCTLKALRRGKQ